MVWGEKMKYIKNKFDDQVSKVTRDMIVDYPLYKPSKNLYSSSKGLRDLVQVYPWEDIEKGLYSDFDRPSTLYHKIRGKWFVEKSTWEAYVKHRVINFSNLVEHVHSDPRIQRRQQGFWRFWFNRLLKRRRLPFSEAARRESKKVISVEKTYEII